jgi:hypothetical protein
MIASRTSAENLITHLINANDAQAGGKFLGTERQAVETADALSG